MFINLSKASKISSLIKPMCFSSTTAYPLLLKRFPNKSDINSSFTITQLEKKDIDDASACLSEALSTREIITSSFNIKYSRIYEGIKSDLQKALDANLCLVCKESNSEKFAGVIYYEDLNDVLDPKIWQDHMEQDENWKKLSKFYKYLYSFISPFAEPKERNDVLLCKKIAVVKEFANLGVATNLMYAARYLHPRTTKAKRRLVITSSELSYKYSLKIGWELIKEIDFKDPNFAENNSEVLKIGKVYILKYEAKGKSLIQEVKDQLVN